MKIPSLYCRQMPLWILSTVVCSGVLETVPRASNAGIAFASDTAFTRHTQRNEEAANAMLRRPPEPTSAYPLLRAFLRTEFGGNAAGNSGFKRFIEEKDYFSVLSELEAALVDDLTPATENLSPEKRRFRKLSLLAFLMREYETNQSFDISKQIGRGAAMVRFLGELDKRFTSELNEKNPHFSSLPKEKREKLQQAAETLAKAAKTFSTIPVSAKRLNPNSFVQLFDQMMKAKSCPCTEDVAEEVSRRLDSIVTRIPWVPDTQSRLLREILHPQPLPKKPDEQLPK